MSRPIPLPPGPFPRTLVDREKARHAVHIQRCITGKRHAPLLEASAFDGLSAHQADVGVALVALQALPELFDGVGWALDALGELPPPVEQMAGDGQLLVAQAGLGQEVEQVQGSEVLCGLGLVDESFEHGVDGAVGGPVGGPRRAADTIAGPYAVNLTGLSP